MVLHDRIKAYSDGRAGRTLPSRGWLGLVCLLLALILPCAAQAKNQEPAGFVVDVKGTWVIVLGDPGGSVHRNSYVYPGQRIQAKQPLANSAITIALANGKAIRRSCVNDAASCDSPIVIDDAPPVSSIASRVGAAVLKLIKPEEEHSAATIARDVFGPWPGVVGLKGGQVDLRPVLKRIPEGSYLAVLAPDHPGEPDAGKETLQYPMVVTSSGPVWIKTDALPPGLYHLSILSSRGNQPVGSAVLVLVASESNSDAQQKDFAEAQAVVSTWDPDIPASSVQYFLTQYLTAMARRAPGKS